MASTPHSFLTRKAAGRLSVMATLLISSALHAEPPVSAPWTEPAYQYRIPLETVSKASGWQRVPLSDEKLTEVINATEKFKYDPRYIAYNHVKLVEVDPEGVPVKSADETGYYLIPVGGNLAEGLLQVKTKDRAPITVVPDRFHILDYHSSSGGNSPASGYETVHEPGHPIRKTDFRTRAKRAVAHMGIHHKPDLLPKSFAKPSELCFLKGRDALRHFRAAGSRRQKNGALRAPLPIEPSAVEDKGIVEEDQVGALAWLEHPGIPAEEAGGVERAHAEKLRQRAASEGAVVACGGVHRQPRARKLPTGVEVHLPAFISLHIGQRGVADEDDPPRPFDLVEQTAQERTDVAPFAVRNHLRINLVMQEREFVDPRLPRTGEASRRGAGGIAPMRGSAQPQAAKELQTFHPRFGMPGGQYHAARVRRPGKLNRPLVLGRKSPIPNDVTEILQDRPILRRVGRVDTAPLPRTGRTIFGAGVRTFQVKPEDALPQPKGKATPKPADLRVQSARLHLAVAESGQHAGGAVAQKSLHHGLGFDEKALFSIPMTVNINPSGSEMAPLPVYHRFPWPTGERCLGDLDNPPVCPHPQRTVLDHPVDKNETDIAEKGGRGILSISQRGHHQSSLI